MARGEPVIYSDFSGGINAEGAPYLLAENQCRSALNVRTSPLGSVKKRNGFTTFNDSTLTSLLDSAHSLYGVNTSTKSLICVGKQAGASNDRIVKITTGGVASTLKSTLTQGKRWEWVMGPTSGGQGPIYGVNGTDTPQQWDGAAASTSDWTASTGSVPNAKYLAYHATRIWAAGVTATPSRVFYSGLSGSAPDPRNWDANNFVDIEPNDGQEITGLATCGAYLVVFKPHKTFVIYDPVTGANRRISAEVGCTAPRTAVESDRGTFFLSEDHGVAVTDGNKVERISDNIKPLLSTAASSPTTFANAAAVWHEDSYHLAISLAGTRNDAILEYDVDTKSWWRHDISSNQFALSDPLGTPILYSVSPGTTARVHKAYVSSVFADEGSTYTGGAFWIGPYYVWGAPHLRKRVHQYRVDGIGNWGLSAATNFTDSFTNLDGEAWESTDTGGTFGGSGIFGGSGTFGPTPGTVEWRYYTPGFGRAWSLKFTNTDTNDFELFSLTAMIRGRTD